MRIVVLDAATLGTDTDLSPLMNCGTVTVWENTAQEEIPQRIEDAEVIVSNKVRLMEPGTLPRSEGKAKRVIDNRKL